jgi:hypothetical protein
MNTALFASQVLIQEVHRLVTTHGRVHRLIWFSLDEATNRRLQRFDTTIPTITSVPAMIKVRPNAPWAPPPLLLQALTVACPDRRQVVLYYYCGLLPFCELEEAILGVPVDEVRPPLPTDQSIAIRAVSSFPLDRHTKHPFS